MVYNYVCCMYIVTTTTAVKQYVLAWIWNCTFHIGNGSYGCCIFRKDKCLFLLSVILKVTCINSLETQFVDFQRCRWIMLASEPPWREIYYWNKVWTIFPSSFIQAISFGSGREMHVCLYVDKVFIRKDEVKTRKRSLGIKTTRRYNSLSLWLL